jgi:hypothetical protein
MTTNFNSCLGIVRKAPHFCVATDVVCRHGLVTDFTGQNIKQKLTQGVLAVTLPAITNLGVTYNAIMGFVRLGTGCISFSKGMPLEEVIREFKDSIRHFATALFDVTVGNLLWLAQIASLLIAGVNLISNFLIDSQKQQNIYLSLAHESPPLVQ